MNYSILKHKNPVKPEEGEKFYPHPVWNQVCSINELANEISLATTLTPADVKACIECLLQAIPHHIMEGQCVKCGEFGSFKLGFSAKGQVKKEDVSASDICKPRVLFRASVALKNAIAKTTFTPVKQYKEVN